MIQRAQRVCRAGLGRRFGGVLATAGVRLWPYDEHRPDQADENDRHDPRSPVRLARVTNRVIRMSCWRRCCSCSGPSKMDPNCPAEGGNRSRSAVRQSVAAGQAAIAQPDSLSRLQSPILRPNRSSRRWRRPARSPACWRRHRPAASARADSRESPGQSVGLQRVLIAHVEANLFDVVARLRRPFAATSGTADRAAR